MWMCKNVNFVGINLFFISVFFYSLKSVINFAFLSERNFLYFGKVLQCCFDNSYNCIYEIYFWFRWNTVKRRNLLDILHLAFVQLLVSFFTILLFLDFIVIVIVITIVTIIVIVIVKVIITFEVIVVFS